MDKKEKSSNARALGYSSIWKSGRQGESARKLQGAAETAAEKPEGVRSWEPRKKGGEEIEEVRYFWKIR